MAAQVSQMQQPFWEHRRLGLEEVLKVLHLGEDWQAT